MTTNILINATQPEEVRVAITEHGQLFDFDIESTHREQKKANIYKGKISRVEPSLNAIFVDYGADRHGFLPMKEIAPEYFTKKPERGQRIDLKASIKEGQEIIVQINKEERGNKGAALSSYITLAGCYLVLMPNNERAGGISRRIEGEERAQLKEALSKLNIPDGMGVIIRTNGLGRMQEELQWDLDALIKLYSAITAAADTKKENFLIYRESDVISRTIRDYLREDINQIIVDTKEAHERVMTHVNRLRPEFANRVKIFKGDKPLFITHRIEHQIETAYQREVTLPSGGVVVIDHTEALTSIDINSSRATKGEDIEETALHTNLEAAMEIARQARLRDLGGLIVIDFIDMLSSRHQRDVESQLAESLKRDRARVQIGRISRFGLLEMSRQRVRPSLGESSHHTCPRCDGQGTIRSVESLGLSIVRLIEEDAASGNFAQFQVELPVSVATFLLNEKRESLNAVENKRNVRVTLIPNQHMDTPTYEIRRFKANGEQVTDKSYRMLPKFSSETPEFLNKSKHEEAAIKSVAIDEPPKRPSLVTRFIKSLFSQSKPEKKPSNQRRNTNNNRRRQHGQGQGQNNQNRRRQEGNKNGQRNRNNSRDNNRRDSNRDDNRQNNRQDNRRNDNRRDDNRNDTRNDNRRNNNQRNDNRRNDNHRDDNRNDTRNDNRREDTRNDNNRDDNRNDNRRDNNRNDNRRGNRQHGRRDNQRQNREPRRDQEQAPVQSQAPAQTPAPVQAQRAPAPAPVQAAPAQAAPVAKAEPKKQPVVSDSVKNVLKNSSTLGSENASQTQTKRPDNYQAQKAMKIDVQEQRTEFSAEQARAKMQASNTRAEQVGSKAASAAKQRLDIDTEQV